jgi:predicted nucleotidyltransferase
MRSPKNGKQLPKGFLVQVAARIRQRLGGNLVAIVLFGSYAKGSAREASDLDLLVVARMLPPSRERADLLTDAFDDLVIETGIAVMPILMTERELRLGMKSLGPLMFGLVTGYQIVWGKLPLLTKWERFVKDRFRLSRKYDAWIIKDPTNLRLKPNLT